MKLSFLPFFAKAAIDALKQHPSLNATIDTETGEVTYFDRENLAIAVDTEKGLLTPVIKDAGDLSIAGLARKIADVAERTRTNKIGPDELSGGTFTLTNTGSRGALFDTPIINQPQVAILGTGAVVKRPVVIDDAEPRRDDRGALDGLPGADLRPPAGRRRRRRPVPLRRQGAPGGRPSSRSDRTTRMRSRRGRRLGVPRQPPDRAALGGRARRRTRWSGGRPVNDGESEWDPYAGTVDRDLIEPADVVVNLAGSPTAGNPHSRRWAERAAAQPRHHHSRAGRGDRRDRGRRPSRSPATASPTTATTADEVLTEDSDSRGDALLTRVTREWQGATDPGARGRGPRLRAAHLARASTGAAPR